MPSRTVIPLSFLPRNERGIANDAAENTNVPRPARASCQADGPGHGARGGNGPSRAGGHRGGHARLRRAAPRQGAQWVQVAAGDDNTCAIRTDGTLWCWGDNRYGQLGLGNQTGQDLPQQVSTPAATGWARATSGFFHTCATRTDTTLWCWGDNYWGELGIGHHPDQHQPAQVTTPGPHEWASVRSSGQDTCAIRRTAGTLWCWGDDANGVLGIGPRPSQYRPQQVTIPT